MREKASVHASEPVRARPGAGATFRPQGAGGGAAGSRGENAAEQRIQRRADGGAGGPAVPSAVGAVLAQPGRPLETPVRAFMERRFGQDFGGVRLHDDPAASASARAVHAVAYTVGDEVVFAEGRYQPGTEAGRALLAHELAHTVQQRGLQRRSDGIALDEGAAYQALERDADAAGSAALQGGPPPLVRAAPGPMLSRATTPPPAKKKKSWAVDVASAYLKSKHTVTRDDTFDAGKKRSAGVTVDALTLPKTKGGQEAISLWQGRAQAGALVAHVSVAEAHSKAALWQEREGTDELRARWRQKRGFQSDREADAAWQAAGGSKEFPYVKEGAKETAGQMDHVIELQVGGGNEDDNIQVLDGADNRASGGAIKLEVFGLAEQVADSLHDEGEDVDEVRLTFKKVVPEGGGKPGKAYLVGQKVQATGKTSKEAEGLEPYEIVAAETEGGATATLRMKANEKDSLIAGSGVPENESASQIISGLILKNLLRPSSKHTIEAGFDTAKGRATRLPISVDEKAKVTLEVVKKKYLRIKDKTPHVAFTYPFLSKGVLTKLEVGDGNALSGEGKITPTARFLPPLTVRFGKDEFSIVTALDKDKLKPPFPGVKVTKAELGIDLLPEFRPRGTVEIALGSGGRDGKPLADALFNVTRDEDGLVLDGTMHVHLPGVEKAEAGFKYAKQAWTGNIRVESSQIKLKYVKSGYVNVAIDEKGVEPSGELELELPGNGVAKLGVRKAGPKWLYHGSGTFAVPRKEVKPVTVHVSYDGEKLAADGETGFQWKGLDGRIHVFFAADQDSVKYWGDARITFAKGKAKGKLDPIKLSPDGKISGKGEASYQLSESLEATAGIEIDEKEKVRFKGALALTKPIELFKRKGGQKELFRTPTITIPIPGLSIGTAGIVVKIYGSLGVHYGIGPGQIQNARLEANFSPFEEDADLDVALQGRLSIPASAGVDAAINGDIALSVLLASVSGGIAIVSTFELGGEAFVEGRMRYSRKKITAEGKAGVRAALDLQLGLKAHVTAEAGVAGFGVRTTKEWDLGKRTFPTGLQFGMAVPIKYASDQAFEMPGLDQIEWSPPPKIDVGQLLDNMMKGAPAKETKS